MSQPKLIASLAKEYLAYVAINEPFGLQMDAGAGHIVGQIKDRWIPIRPDHKPGARALFAHIAEALKPIIDTVHPTRMFRVIIVVKGSALKIPPHDRPPAVSAAFDAETGDYHHYHSTSSSAAIAHEDLEISHGLTLLLQPYGLWGESWTNGTGQGGNMFHHSEQISLDEAYAKLEWPIAQEMLKPVPAPPPAAPPPAAAAASEIVAPAASAPPPTPVMTAKASAPSMGQNH